MITKERLAEIKERCDKATPEPWYVPLHGNIISDESMSLFEVLGKNEQAYANMRFVCAARKDLPELLTEYEQLTGSYKKSIILLLRTVRWHTDTGLMPADLFTEIQNHLRGNEDND